MASTKITEGSNVQSDFRLLTVDTMQYVLYHRMYSTKVLMSFLIVVEGDMIEFTKEKSESPPINNIPTTISSWRTILLKASYSVSR